MRVPARNHHCCCCFLQDVSIWTILEKFERGSKSLERPKYLRYYQRLAGEFLIKQHRASGFNAQMRISSSDHTVASALLRKLSLGAHRAAIGIRTLSLSYDPCNCVAASYMRHQYFIFFLLEV